MLCYSLPAWCNLQPIPYALCSDGLTIGIIEGRELGVQKGYELGRSWGTHERPLLIVMQAQSHVHEAHANYRSNGGRHTLAGLEIGFYTGCVRMWRQLQTRDPTVIPERAMKAVANVEEILASIQLDDPQARIQAA